MTGCEFFEIEISTLLDGELSTDQALEAVDHVLTCAECRDFYRRGRTLDRKLAEVEHRTAANQLPADLWSRIDRATNEDTQQSPWRLARPWALRLAAAAVIVAGVWIGARFWPTPAPGVDGVVNVELEGDRGAMTDDRFIALTTELLQADRRYHAKMQEIMVAVNRHAYSVEGSPEGPAAPWDEGVRSAALQAPETDDTLRWY